MSEAGAMLSSCARWPFTAAHHSALTLTPGPSPNGRGESGRAAAACGLPTQSINIAEAPKPNRTLESETRLRNNMRLKDKVCIEWPQFSAR